MGKRTADVKIWIILINLRSVCGIEIFFGVQSRTGPNIKARTLITS